PSASRDSTLADAASCVCELNADSTQGQMHRAGSMHWRRIGIASAVRLFPGRGLALLEDLAQPVIGYSQASRGLIHGQSLADDEAYRRPIQGGFHSGVVASHSSLPAAQPCARGKMVRGPCPEIKRENTYAAEAVGAARQLAAPHLSDSVKRLL